MRKLKIFTDGSSRGNPSPHCGCSYVIVENGIVLFSKGNYIPNATNNIAEMQGVINGLKKIEEMKKKESFEMIGVEILSDSAYVVNCINNRWYIKWKNNGWKTADGNNVKNKKLWIEIIGLYEKLMPTFTKVRGHSGNFYNELADTLAKKASASEGI